MPFLGWRITNQGVFILSKTKRRMLKQLTQINFDFEIEQVDEEKTIGRIQCVYAARRL